MSAPLDLRRLNPPPRRILAVKLSSFGDIIHATPALHAIAAAFPQAQLILAVESRWRDVVRYAPYLSGAIPSSSRTALTPAYLWEIERTLSAAVAPGRFDVAIDFQGTRRSAAWVYLSRARVRTGRGLVRPGWRGARLPDLNRHAVRVCADVCENIGVTVSDLSPRIYTGTREETELDTILDRHGLARAGFVLLNPFSRWASKSWSAEKSADLATRIHRDLAVPVIVTGGPDDRDQCDDVVRLAGAGVASLAGELTLGQALCLYRRGRLMISCDSGPMHAAAALDVPVVALFGPTHPERTGPWGHRHKIVQALRPSDHHAYRSDPGGQYMAALMVDHVFHAVAETLAGPGVRALA